jgi:heme peroxidase
MLDRSAGGGRIPAGYTYFGQFIDHDLTKMDPLTPPFFQRVLRRWARWRKPNSVFHRSRDIRNLQSPRLDLSHLYGGGPSASPVLYEADGVRLKLGPLSASGRPFDVYVDSSNERPVLADDRSTENVILRQIVAVFAWLHNAAAAQWETRIPNDPPRLFEKARQQTVWQFQYLVVKDYLKKILDARVYREVFEEGKLRFEWKKSFSLPVEFAVAAFRFGHTMVRPGYFLSTEDTSKDFTLPEILGRALEPKQLESRWKIKWGFFFPGIQDGSSFNVTAQPIDTLLAEPLHDLKSLAHLAHQLVHLFPIAKLQLSALPIDHFKLPVRSLLRGESMRLASGQTAADSLGEARLTTEQLLRARAGTPEQTPHGPILNRAQLVSETPLFYYILKESEIVSDGDFLGPVGSRIVAETISAALRYDPSSYFFSPYPIGSPEWRERNQLLLSSPPGVWQMGGTETPIYELFQLFLLASEPPTDPA